MRVLVLGSEGTLGKSVCNYLNKKEIDIIRWDIKISTDHDLRKSNCIDDVLKIVDYVIFLAFDVGGSKYDVNNKEFIDSNVLLLYNTFESLSKVNVPFLYTTSTMSNMISNPYGVLKCLSNFYVKYLNGLNVRLWNVYGDEDISDKTHVIPDFVHQACATGKITMLSDGKDERQFLYCDDLSDAIYNIMTNHNVFIQKNNVIDITSFEWTTINEIAEIIKNIFAETYKINIIIERNLYAHDNHSLKNEPEMSLLHKTWSASTSLKQGIANIIAKHIKNIALRELSND